MKVCNTPGCPTIYDSPDAKCDSCRSEGRRASDQRRGTATQRGYNTPGHQAFRRAVIRRDMVCVLCEMQPSTVADHHPKTRKQLIAEGLNPNDPTHGRGLCKPCHDSETARNQPGGWNQ